MNYNSTIKINDSHIGLNQSPYIIAEMACAHNGNFEEAIQLIDASKEAGANATQLQFFVPEYTVTPNHGVYSVLQKIAFSNEEWTKIFNHGRAVGIDVWVCTYDHPSVDLAVQLGADGIKLNSADLSNPKVLKAVAESKIPFTLGTGASTFEEITRGLSYLYKNGARDIVLMQGVQNFPTQNKDLNIARLNLLKSVFPNIPVGYADHTDGEDSFGKIVDLIALGAGAVVFEKHITLDRSEKGIDYQAALEPKEYKTYVKTLHHGYEAFGKAQIKPFSESDLKYRKFQKKGIVAIEDLKEGDVISDENVEFLRNEIPGMSPLDFYKIKGKKLVKSVKKFDNINENDVA